ncbi:hypothetical protein trd_1368 [Thermomicrobium roseum DSM 5159]|uniref:Uncharacterized protein n=1 Tax=Thermomicrobium roseum (strain ATCC 27502 / DSM 5159 / P-2) TaxID=309801 RepID=B9L2G5_THERP|nr:hypothetical protein trd_1368 [Thermomicrobium roseum DSM 5159]
MVIDDQHPNPPSVPHLALPLRLPITGPALLASCSIQLQVSLSCHHRNVLIFPMVLTTPA